MKPDLRKPVLFVTGHVPPDRVGAFARLHELEDIEVALFGGPSKHGPPMLAQSWTADLPFPSRRVSERESGRLAASGRHRAVVCSTGGRVALPATWAGARRAHVRLILWASLWAHPRTGLHLMSFLALRRLYRSADAIVTYGPHVSAYVSARGARNVHVAPQSVDNDFWSAPVPVPPVPAPPGPTAGTNGGHADPSPWPGEARVRFLFAGRHAREKGIETLTEAWSKSGLRPPAAALALVGVGSTAVGSTASGADAAGVSRLDAVARERMREIYAEADVLVVPSIATRTFREPWGLVVNEAMSRGLPVIASDSVGAVAGGLLRDGRNGLVVAAADSDALAGTLRRMTDDPGLRARLGGQGAQDVRAYTHDAWAWGFSEALSTLGLSRAHC